MASVNLHVGDNRLSLASLPENSVDGVVTDPPYSLTSITKRFGKEGSKAARTDGNDGSFARVSGGFMGMCWDATGIERDPAFWAAVYRVLKPGAFAFAFAGARTGHWQACAMEQAGFVMHPMHAWLYGQGFPKGHDASKAIDKHMGTTGQREVTGSAKMRDIRNGHGRGLGDGINASARDGSPTYLEHEYSTGGSPEARQWDGWKYGTQTQKPAMEPIYLGQKPYDGKPVESILKWGVGAFNIDGCRVPMAADDFARTQRCGDYGETAPGVVGFTKTEMRSPVNPEGRYPANVLHDGSAEVVALFPESAGQLATESSSSSSRKDQNVYGAMARGSAGREPRGDAGSAARFFNCFDDYPLAFYHPKAGKADRAGSKHPTVKPIGLLRHLIRHICPPGGTVLDPFAGSGTTAAAAIAESMNCVLMEAEPDYVAFLRQRFELASDGFENGELDDLDAMFETPAVDDDTPAEDDLDAMFA